MTDCSLSPLHPTLWNVSRPQGSTSTQPQSTTGQKSNRLTPGHWGFMAVPSSRVLPVGFSTHAEQQGPRQSMRSWFSRCSCPVLTGPLQRASVSGPELPVFPKLAGLLTSLGHCQPDGFLSWRRPAVLQNRQTNISLHSTVWGQPVPLAV